MFGVNIYYLRVPDGLTITSMIRRAVRYQGKYVNRRERCNRRSFSQTHCGPRQFYYSYFRALVRAQYSVTRRSSSLFRPWYSGPESNLFLETLGVLDPILERVFHFWLLFLVSLFIHLLFHVSAQQRVSKNLIIRLVSLPCSSFRTSWGRIRSYIYFFMIHLLLFEILVSSSDSFFPLVPTSLLRFRHTAARKEIG